MKKNNHMFRAILLCGALPLPGVAFAQTNAPDSPGAQGGSTVAEIIVTAQKRQENINNVGMSIQAATGDQLVRAGVTDTSQLVNIVPGFNYTPSFTGTPVFTIRGVGFQDNALGDSPTVSVYIDEAPLPFSILTKGATLDLQRVEVLKGPQGTLFGENATGGAINYIAQKPTDAFAAGGDLSYGRFNKFDAQAYVSGPITDTLDFRIAGRIMESGPWQHSYAPQRQEAYGSQNFYNVRGALLWKPTINFKALLTVNAWQDRSETQVPQLVAVTPRTANTPLPPGLLSFPAAPYDNQAADFNSCINVSSSGRNGCVGSKSNNTFEMGSLRLDYDLPHSVRVTSISTYEKFNRFQPQDEDGTPYQDFESVARGSVVTEFQELRVAGDFGGKGSWIVGGNYEHDKTAENIFSSYNDSTNSTIAGLPLGPTNNTNYQETNTYSGYANADFPVTRSITAQGGARYTSENRSYRGCTADGGDGTWANIAGVFGSFITGKYDNVGAGNCATLSAAGVPGEATGTLNEDNVSWRAGLNWAAAPGTLLYANVSKGYKSGSFPTLSAPLAVQLRPVVQEGLLAYEGGFKSSFFDRTLQINGAVFYYDYSNKQILGYVNTGIFGSLPALVNIPKSRVVGFEFSGGWSPIPGLTITPGVSYTNSRIENNFTNYNYLALQQNFGGESFPSAPKWQANVDGQYEWPLRNGLRAFLGGNLNYQGKTNSTLGDVKLFDVPAHALLDLRAGLEKGSWRVQLWGRNVLNKYYWTYAAQVNDDVVRYTGMPATYGVTLTYRYN